MEQKSGLSSPNGVVSIFDNDEKQGGIYKSSLSESNICFSM